MISTAKEWLMMLEALMMLLAARMRIIRFLITMADFLMASLLLLKFKGFVSALFLVLILISSSILENLTLLVLCHRTVFLTASL